ncbi:MAG TPA: NADP-dependent oxidoreductase [Verrucomicrobiae bacterium]|nr:NADP-dependent oxidoreductase [Verrucomicrobiae bacterium]
MKAVYLNQKAGPEALTWGDLPQPAPGEGEVLVKVKATAVTPTEFQWYPTFNLSTGEPRPFPIVLSHEFSGVVEALGPGVENFKPGDAVFGLNDWFAGGAQAEFCVAPASALARKPRLLDYTQAAVVPLSALTAWQGLLCKTNVQRGQRVLIHGAAGGVGVFAVQLARWRGAHVIATASAANLDFVRMLGAEQVIDYQTSRFEDMVRDVDVVFDTVGGETLERSWQVLKPGGKLVTIAAQSGGATEQRVRDAFLLVRADGRQLGQIAGLIDAGDLRVFVEGTFPLARAREAYARAHQGKMRGKIALRVAE